MGVHRNSNSKNGRPLGSVWVHSLPLSYTPKIMKCDFQASLLALTFASPCLGCECKARVATQMDIWILGRSNRWNGKGAHFFEKKRKHWNVFLTSLSNHVNGKTRQKKVGPQNMLIKKNYATYIVAWTFNMWECKLSIVLQQFKWKWQNSNNF